MADVNVEKTSYSGFERFLFFLTPVLFTAALLFMLLLLFNPDWRNKALELGNQVPVLRAVLPNPSSTTPPPISDEEITVANARSKVEELNALLAEREASLREAVQLTEAQQKEIDELKLQIERLTEENREQEISTEEYMQRIKSLSTVYARMAPGKAAPILESMTAEEAALMLGAMAETERTRILEKMTPRVAADITLRMKDAEAVHDQQIAALQSRVKELELLLGENNSTLDLQELNNTFSSMQPANAAKLLLEMAASDQPRALLVLGAMGDAARSQVLAAMTAEDSKLAAELVAKLMPAAPSS